MLLPREKGYTQHRSNISGTSEISEPLVHESKAFRCLWSQWVASSMAPVDCSLSNVAKCSALAAYSLSSVAYLAFHVVWCNYYLQLVLHHGRYHIFSHRQQQRCGRWHRSRYVTTWGSVCCYFISGRKQSMAITVDIEQGDIR